MRSRHGLTLLASVALLLSARAQAVIEARVVDGASGAALAYASISARNSGAITNEEGRFRLALSAGDDSLAFSYLGYRRLVLPASAFPTLTEVRLESAEVELASVEVHGRNDALKRLVIASAKALDRIGRHRAKLYFELETRAADQPVEVIEGLYNATCSGPEITELDLKNGRLGMAPFEGRYFANLNTSRGIMLLHPTRSSDDFPASPLQYRSVKALGRDYEVTLLAIVHDPQELYHLLLEPRTPNGTFFTADLWVDPATAEVHSLQLSCDSCARHPFLPLDPKAVLRDLSLRFKQTWTRHRGHPVMDHVELDYAVTYIEDGNKTRMAAGTEGYHAGHSTRTKGVLHFFDHDSAFILPLFRYPEGMTDYRKISLFPYDGRFWRSVPTLVRTEQQERDLTFFDRHGVMLGHRYQPPGLRGREFFSDNNAIWAADRRVRVKQVTRQAPEGGGLSTRYTALPVSSLIDLQVQIFLNIDPDSSGYRTFSATVFDGFRSRYEAPEQPWTDVFLNLFFDLCEMERRRMQAELDVPGLSLERIRRIHQEAEDAMARTTYRYMTEVKYGADAAALQRWNDRVRDALGIDNIAVFKAADPPATPEGGAVPPPPAR
ncbi:MAG: hypothetical protein JST66_08665 [Bacteroidetes bacterium]|nr:hypothetical protein [Bacteroidota bacterium]